MRCLAALGDPSQPDWSALHPCCGFAGAAVAWDVERHVVVQPGTGSWSGPAALGGVGAGDRADVLIDVIETRSGSGATLPQPWNSAVERRSGATDERAIRLGRQTLLLSEFLQREAAGWQPPRLHRKALVHGHCHHKAIMKLTDEQQLLARLGLDAEVLDAGCCGLAGSFGYERGERYQVSIKAGERVLLPAIREAAEDTLVIADGFSCQEQIAHGTDRRALHLAQVLQLAMRYGRDGPPGDHPEQAVLPLG
jgi:hypothetical protein